MSDPSSWTPDQDPPRDERLGRLLRQADVQPPGAGIDWERLHAAVMRGARWRWWDVVVQWRRVAAAASVAAMLAAGALLWSAGSDSSDVVSQDDAAPESVALAQVVAAYPDDAVFTSMLQNARNDEFTSWVSQ
jgi:hypothetical protein